MRPTDLTLERDQRERRRLALTVRHVTIAANAQDSALITGVLDLVDQGAMTAADAQSALAAMQRTQQAAA